MREQSQIDESQYDCILRPGFDLMAAHIVQLQAQLKSDMDGQCDARILLDLTKCIAVDSQGMGLIVGTFKEAKKHNCSFQVAISSDFIIKLFKMMQLDKHLDVFKVPGP